jgi:phosphoribosylanthranilate isomerase
MPDCVTPQHVIKVCGITNAADALEAAAAGATALGFNFYPKSKRYIQPDEAARIAAGLPLCKVGVFVNESPAEVARIASLVGLDVVQLHGEERPEEFPSGLRVWKALRVGPDFTPADLDAYQSAEAILLDGPAGAEYGGTGKVFPWSVAAGLSCRVILAGGLDGSNVGAAVAAAQPWGVDACSRIESAPGKKDRIRMEEFVKAARRAAGLGET